MEAVGKHTLPPLHDRLIGQGRRGSRILCLDGGGVRGVVTILILMKIEELTKKKITQLFDLVCGTSTGAIIAMAILNKIELSTLLAIYVTNSKAVFPQGLFAHSSQASRFSSHSVLYDVYKMKQLVENCVGSSICEKSLYEFPQYPKTFLVSTDGHNKPFLFTTYGGEGEGSCCDVTLSNALLCSTAAPVYFPSVKLVIQNETKWFSDGGLVANNPTKLAVNEARHLWRDILVSVGTGASHTGDEPETNESGLLSLFNRLATLCTSSTNIHEEVLQNLKTDIYKFQYHRYNPYVGNIGLDASDETTMTFLQNKTEGFLNDNATDLLKLAEALKTGI